MFALERKTRPLVTEGINGDADYVGVAAEVIGVAGVAMFDAGQRRLAVKAGFTLAVTADLVVTVQAQSGHGGFVERRVAAFALGLKLGVAGDDITGHQRALLDGHFLRPGTRTEEDA